MKLEEIFNKAVAAMPLRHHNDRYTRQEINEALARCTGREARSISATLANLVRQGFFIHDGKGYLRKPGKTPTPTSAPAQGDQRQRLFKPEFARFLAPPTTADSRSLHFLPPIRPSKFDWVMPLETYRLCGPKGEALIPYSTEFLQPATREFEIKRVEMSIAWAIDARAQEGKRLRLVCEGIGEGWLRSTKAPVGHQYLGQFLGTLSDQEFEYLVPLENTLRTPYKEECAEILREIGAPREVVAPKPEPEPEPGSASASASAPESDLWLILAKVRIKASSLAQDIEKLEAALKRRETRTVRVSS
jgi:hypothetical protein